MPSSVHQNFIDYAKETIYERALMKGLQFDSAHIMHVKDRGHDIVWLHHYMEKVIDEETGEEVEVERPVMFAEYVENFGLTSRIEGDNLVVTMNVPEIRIADPDLIIVRKPDGTILNRPYRSQHKSH